MNANTIFVISKGAVIEKGIFHSLQRFKDIAERINQNNKEKHAHFGFVTKEELEEEEFVPQL